MSAPDQALDGIKRHRIAAILPCYKARDHVLQVIGKMPEIVDLIICIDDACPEGTGRHVGEHSFDPRVKLIFHEKNKGVGGAVCTGYRAALAAEADICVKIDSDGQMDPEVIPYLVKSIIDGRADYCKGNRFASIEDVKGMPTMRILGNVMLSFLTKLSSGYWHIFDPTNGFTAIHSRVLERLPLDKLSERYFFESDMLFRLGTFRACVVDVPIPASYGSEISNLKISRIFLPFLVGNIRNMYKRIFYNYFLRDFSVASTYLVFGIASFVLGVTLGSQFWITSIQTGRTATAGLVMMAALPLIFGLQLLLSFLNYDVERTPSIPLHPLLPPLRR